MSNPLTKIMGVRTSFPQTQGVGRMYAGGIIDQKFQASQVFTWENVQGLLQLFKIPFLTAPAEVQIFARVDPGVNGVHPRHLSKKIRQKGGPPIGLSIVGSASMPRM